MPPTTLNSEEPDYWLKIRHKLILTMGNELVRRNI